MSDETFDFSHIQHDSGESVRLMLSALAKAIRTQSSDIKELDQRISDGAFSRADANRWSLEMQSRFAEKDDIIELANRMVLKADESYASSIDSKLSQTIDQLERLGDMMRIQATSIRDINSRIDFMGKEIDALKVPNFEAVFAYIDRQNNHIATDFDRKLAIKADKKDIEICVPQRIEDLYRSLSGSMVELKSEVSKKATKEDFESLSRSKADADELHTLSEDLTEKTSLKELQDLVDSQIKPLQLGLATVEKSISYQEKHNKTSSDQYVQLLEKLANGAQQQSQQSTTTDLLLAKKIRSIIEEILLEKRVGEVTEMSLQTSIQEQTNRILREVSSLINTSKLEGIANTHDSIHQSIQPINQRLDTVAATAQENKNKLSRMKNNMKDFSENVAKSLGRKVDVVDIKRALKEVVLEQDSLKRQLVNASHSAFLADQTVSASSSKPLSASALSTASIGNRQQSINSSIMKSLNDDKLAETISRYKTDSLFHRSNSLESDNYLRPSNSTATRLFYSSPEDDSSTSNTREYYSSNSSNDENEFGPRSASKPTEFNSPIRNKSKSGSKSGNKSRISIGGSVKDGTAAVSQSYNQIKRDFAVVLQGMESMQKEFIALKKKYELDLATIRESIDSKASSSALMAVNSRLDSVPTTSTTVIDRSFDNTEWRIAMGDLAMNLRREISEKCSREEMLTSLRHENASLESRAQKIEKDLEARASEEGLKKIENELTSLRSKVAGELTGARWLWTSATLGRDGWIPWDHQVTNAAPAVLLWKKSSTVIKVRMAGLYRLCFAVFTTIPVAVQVCVNGEVVISLQPDTGEGTFVQGRSSGVINSPVALSSEHKYVLRHMRHSIGEVTCVSIDECLSLPMDGAISIRYHSTHMAQGFLSLRKL